MSKHTHSDRLERWLGKEAVANLSFSMRDFYSPVAVHGVPGAVYAMPGGDFTGEIRAGQEMSALDRAADILKRDRAERRASIARHRIAASLSLREKLDTRRHAFASLEALLASSNLGKSHTMNFQKVGVTQTAGCSADLWTAGGSPSGGSAGSAAPTGSAYANSSVGSLNFYNAGVADSARFIGASVTASVGGNSLLLIDRLWAISKAMNSTAAEAVTGIPLRYQSTNRADDDFIGGNFCYPMVPTTALDATAHSWTLCQYVNHAGTTGRSFPTHAGRASTPIGGIDLAAGKWFMEITSSDIGIKSLTQIQCNALVAAGTISFAIAHPIAFFPCPVANLVCPVDGIYTAFNLQKILDNCCLSFLELTKTAATATTYSGIVQTVSE